MRSIARASSRRLPGDFSELVPPVPIPNTEVKRLSADDSVAHGHARVGHRQAPNEEAPGLTTGGFFIFRTGCRTTRAKREWGSRTERVGLTGNSPGSRQSLSQAAASAASALENPFKVSYPVLTAARFELHLRRLAHVQREAHHLNLRGKNLAAAGATTAKNTLRVPQEETSALR